MTEEDELIAQLEGLSLSRVCYVYDEAMTLHVGDAHHPERPDRIRTVHDEFLSQGLLAHVQRLPSRKATADELSLAHSRELVEKVLGIESNAALIGGPQDELVKQKKFIFPFDHDTYVCHASAAAAQLACGSVLSVVDAVMTGACTRGFAAVRPPGHHATREKSMGFCLVNNVAVAAEYARKHHGVTRVAIIDWDVHHGNGTADIFHESADVLFVSVHRYDRGKFYPSSGHLDDIGAEQGRGFNINVPIDGSYGDEEMLYAWDHVVVPAISAFCPELVLISAGYDAAEHDPLGQCRVRCGTYGVLIERLLEKMNAGTLAETCKGRLILVLEGGYNLKSIAAASVASMRALLDFDFKSGLSSPASSDGSIRSVPAGVPKSSVIKMVHEVTKLVSSVPGGLRIPIAPASHPFTSRKDRLNAGGQKRFVPVPVVTVPAAKDFLLVSGGGHLDGLVRSAPGTVEKKTTVREALCYYLISLACGAPVTVEVVPGSKVVWDHLVHAEKRRINFEARKESFVKLSEFTCKCERVVIRSEASASVILEDLTFGLAADDNLGVVDMKLGTEYHTPEDGPDRILTRRQKAATTSAHSLGLRMTACKCMDGFSVSKHKAAKMKLMEQMVPLVRRFLYSSVENFDTSIATAAAFSESLLLAFESKSIDLRFIASSVLFVVGKSGGSVELRCKMIDLAHMYPPQEDDGILVGCKNLVLLLKDVQEPSYESA